jgi:hypothetical protein
MLQRLRILHRSNTLKSFDHIFLWGSSNKKEMFSIVIGWVQNDYEYKWDQFIRVSMKDYNTREIIKIFFSI